MQNRYYQNNINKPHKSLAENFKKYFERFALFASLGSIAYALVALYLTLQK